MGSQKKKKKRKIVPYRQPLNLNVGMIIFFIIFIYMSFSVYAYMKRDKVQVYEVVEGSIVNEKRYTGIIFREETTKYTDRAGYVNYYVREGKRARVGTSVYSIDETGSVASFLQEHPEASGTFSEENLAELKKQLSSFSLTFDEQDFRSVYDEKYSLEALVLEYANFNAMDSLQTMMDQAGVNFQQVTADQAGIVSYAIDSYEDLDPSQVTEEMFDRTNYAKAITQSGNMIASDAPVYKIITSDNWSVVFPIREEDLAEYGSASSLRVSFDGTDLTAAGDFSTITGADGKTYGKLDFNKYMVQFVSDRFVQFEILQDEEDGLKIPISAVTNKTFYLVPLDYLAKGGDEESSETGFMKEVYTEEGTSLEFVPTTIYYSTDEYFYIDLEEDNGLKPGDYLVKPGGINVPDVEDAQEAEGDMEPETNEAAADTARAADNGGRFQIGANASLQGVYNINKGYAVFKQIKVLSENDEFYTVEKGTSYGLSVYDHIALDADTVEEGALIYQ
ncbi:MAG TPA: hypothetical protein IAA51_06635 [Candidatus Cottocaccamicrobium excrementipullorum]|nr:hypothetical protein [Candidatus Cottocaccamicrobium excrementipullorum]